MGLSAETSSMFNPYLFMGLADAQALFRPGDSPGPEADDGILSFLLIEVESQALVSDVQQDIEEAVPSIGVFTPTDLAANDVAMARRLMGSVMDLLVGVTYVVGILVIGITLYAAVFERLREYGIMKAIGARNRYLLSLVAFQTLVIALLSLGLPWR